MSGPQNKKWPPFLSTKTKRIARARKLVEDHLQVKTTKGKQADFQGIFSETLIITLVDGHKAVIQFRAEPLDIAPFERARKLLGHYCPKVQLLHDQDLENLEKEGKETFYPVYSTYIEGKPWCDNPKQGKEPDFNIAVMRSLGKVLAKCISNEASSPNTIQEEIVDKLDRRLKSNNEKLEPFREFIKDLKDQALSQRSALQELPLFQSHMDLNDMNIMVNDEGTVTGIIDWELSPPLQPFAMGLHRLHDLAGFFRDGVYLRRREYEGMEQELWSEIIKALSGQHRKQIMNNLQAVQLAFTVGVILNAFDFDTGAEYIHNATLAVLPKLLTYRIPMLRGNNEPAYADLPAMETKN